MRTTKKWTIALLCFLLLIGQVIGSVAESTSIGDLASAGREAAYTLDFVWHESPLIDEQTNQIMSSLMSSLTVDGRYAYTDDVNGYNEFSLSLSGQEAITFNVLTTEEGMYIASSMMGEPIAIAYDEVAQYFTNLGVYLEEMEQANGASYASTSYADMFKQMAAAFEGMDEALIAGAAPADPVIYDADALMEAYAVYGMDTIVMAAVDWITTEIQPEPFDGKINSEAGVTTSHADVYAITKDMLIDFVRTVWAEMETNETYWTFVADTFNAQVPPEEQASVEEIMAQLPEVGESLLQSMEEMPDDIQMRYVHCYNSAGDYVLSMIEVIVPSEMEEDNPFVFYAEWLPDGLPIYVEAKDSFDGITLNIKANESLPGGVQDDGFSAILDIYDYGDVVGQAKLETTSVVTESGDTRVWDAGLLASMDIGYTSYGVQFILNQVDTLSGGDVTKKAAIDVNLAMGEATLPLVTVNAAVHTQDPTAPSLSAADSYIRPGAMNAEEFSAYMQEVTASSVQSVLYIVSLLPTDIMTMIMQETTY